MHEISIIIPVYNVETYLRECLDSVLNQTFTDFEMICIDDASSDGSMKVLREYETKDNRIVVLSNSCNKGLSYSRNMGLNQSCGKYILFLDSDDFLAEDALSKLYSVIEEQRAEVVSFSSETISEFDDVSTGYSGVRKYCYQGKMDGVTCYLRQVEEKEYKCAVWQYLYCADFLKKNNLKFIEGIYHEDLYFTFLVYMYTQNIIIIRDVLHYYRNRPNSITTGADIKKRTLSIFYSYMESLKYAMNINTEDTERDRAVEAHLSSMKCGLIDCFQKCTKEQKNMCLKEMTGIRRHIFLSLINCAKTINLDVQEIAFLKKQKKIYLYGAGKYARKIIYELSENGIMISGIVVTKMREGQTQLFGYQIYEYQKVLDKLKGALIIIGVSDKYLNEIKNVLCKNAEIEIFNIR